MLENVTGIRNKKHRKHFNKLLRQLKECRLRAYAVSWRTVNSRSFGLPQNRKRIYITGARRSTRKGVKTRKPNMVHSLPESKFACLDDFLEKGLPLAQAVSGLRAAQLATLDYLHSLNLVWTRIVVEPEVVAGGSCTCDCGNIARGDLPEVFPGSCVDDVPVQIPNTLRLELLPSCQNVVPLGFAKLLDVHLGKSLSQPQGAGGFAGIPQVPLAQKCVPRQERQNGGQRHVGSCPEGGNEGGAHGS